ncbi:hypothetical protein JOD54_005617 [Actinokineospora baliensis]|nr:hypothetical protein [Actinokineospora baliensis]
MSANDNGGRQKAAPVVVEADQLLTILRSTYCMMPPLR